MRTLEEHVREDNFIKRWERIKAASRQLLRCKRGASKQQGKASRKRNIRKEAEQRKETKGKEDGKQKKEEEYQIADDIVVDVAGAGARGVGNH